MLSKRGRNEGVLETEKNFHAKTQRSKDAKEKQDYSYEKILLWKQPPVLVAWVVRNDLLRQQ
jgi:hypothetical protein